VIGFELASFIWVEISKLGEGNKLPPLTSTPVNKKQISGLLVVGYLVMKFGYNCFVTIFTTQGESTMSEKSVEFLNKAVADELSAVHQYMYFHFHCEDQGYDLLAGLFMKTAIEEMGHIERCAERILFLGGEVEMVASAGVQKIHEVKKMLELARGMEEQSAKDYNLWANECSANADAGSRKVFEGLVGDEERHFDQYDNEMVNINKYGERYLALQSIERSKSISLGTET
jgi:bacterioferritin